MYSCGTSNAEAKSLEVANDLLIKDTGDLNERLADNMTRELKRQRYLEYKKNCTGNVLEIFHDMHYDCPTYRPIVLCRVMIIEIERGALLDKCESL